MQKPRVNSKNAIDSRITPTFENMVYEQLKTVQERNNGRERIKSRCATHNHVCTDDALHGAAHHMHTLPSYEARCIHTLPSYEARRIHMLAGHARPTLHATRAVRGQCAVVSQPSRGGQGRSEVARDGQGRPGIVSAL